MINLNDFTSYAAKVQVVTPPFAYFVSSTTGKVCSPAQMTKMQEKGLGGSIKQNKVAFAVDIETHELIAFEVDESVSQAISSALKVKSAAAGDLHKYTFELSYRKGKYTRLSISKSKRTFSCLPSKTLSDKEHMSCLNQFFLGSYGVNYAKAMES